MLGAAALREARRRFPRQGSPTVNLVISRAKGLQINERENRRLMQVSSDPAARCRREPEGGVVRLESGQTFAGPELLKHTASVQGLICGDGSALATPRFLTSQGAQRLRNPRNLAQPGAPKTSPTVSSLVANTEWRTGTSPPERARGFKPIDSHEWKFYVEGTNVWKQNYKTGEKIWATTTSTSTRRVKESVRAGKAADHRNSSRTPSTGTYEQNGGRKARKREEEKAAAEERKGKKGRKGSRKRERRLKRQEKKANEEKAAAQAVAKEEKAKKAAVEEQRKRGKEEDGGSRREKQE